MFRFCENVRKRELTKSKCEKLGFNSILEEWRGGDDEIRICLALFNKGVGRK